MVFGIRSYCSVPEPGARQPVVLTHRFFASPLSAGPCSGTLSSTAREYLSCVDCAPDIQFSRCCYVTPSLSFQKGGVFGNLFCKKSPDFFQNSFVSLPHRCVRDAENSANLSRRPLLNIDQFNQEAFFVREYEQRVFQLVHLFPLQESIFRGLISRKLDAVFEEAFERIFFAFDVSNTLRFRIGNKPSLFYIHITVLFSAAVLVVGGINVVGYLDALSLNGDKFIHMAPFVFGEGRKQEPKMQTKKTGV
ncbi:MAG: hypothetical protein VB034_06165 [Eubacteriales bacterium]|nr:hypothetical protein [Eubacteriales bacterium]